MPAHDGETLIMMGEPSDAVIELRSGVARAVSYSSQGCRQVMAFFFPGDLIGLPLSQEHRYSAEAIGGVRFARHRPEWLDRWIGSENQRKASMSLAIWNEEKAFIARGLILGRLSVEARLAAFLRYLAGKQPISDGCFDFVIPQVDLASYLATSPETICRVLRKLRIEKVIAMPRKDCMQIMDGNHLARIAER